MSGKKTKVSKWTQYTVTNRHEKRAELVCTTCHAKKIKCDLQSRHQHGIQDCTYCSTNGRLCQARLSRRRKGTAPTKSITSFQPVESTSNLPIQDGAILSNQTLITPRNYQNDGHVSVQKDLPPDQPLKNGVQSTDQIEYVHGDADSCPVPLNAVNENASQQSTKQAESEDRSMGLSGTRNKRRLASESHTGDVDTGFLQVYRRETMQDAHTQALAVQPQRTSSIPSTRNSPELLDIFAETYFDDCYAWCPVLDRETLRDDLASSLLLQSALAVLGSHVRPPMLPHDGPSQHYERARRMFYEDEEPDTLKCLQAVLLFYWWAPRSTAAVHRHSSWWWTSVVIRHAQQMSVHRARERSTADTPMDGVWRRVWWTAFARERLTALCQSKPPIINPDDCSIPAPSLNDFPLSMKDSLKPNIFIKWVQLCEILGRIAQLLSRSATPPVDISHKNLAEDLTAWMNSLPSAVQLSLTTRYASKYDKDIYQLHIPYLTAIIVLHLKKAPETGALPLALPPAVFAASGIARIFRDILARGDTRFLMPITSWHCGISFLALLATSQDLVLGQAAKEDMHIIVLMCDQLRKMWASAEVIYRGFDRLRHATESGTAISAHQPVIASMASSSNVEADRFEWLNFFPFASSETSETIRLLLELRQSVNNDANTMTWDYSSLLDPSDWYSELQNLDFVLDDEVFYPWST